MDCNCTNNYELVSHVEPHFKHIYKFIVTETYLRRMLDERAVRLMRLMRFQPKKIFSWHLKVHAVLCVCVCVCVALHIPRSYS